MPIHAFSRSSSSTRSDSSLGSAICGRFLRGAINSLCLIIFLFRISDVYSHPWCVPDGTPNIPNPPLTYCGGYNDWPGACCTAANEAAFTKNVVDTIIPPGTNDVCYAHVKESYCAFCSPLAGHKFDAEAGTQRFSPWLCPRFCGRFYDACKDVALNTDGPRSVGGVLRVPGLKPNAGMVKIGDLYSTKSQFCGNYSLLNVGGCHTNNPAELLTEEGDQMPGVPYKVVLAYPNLNLTTIPKRNPVDRPHIVDMIPYGDGTDRVVVTFQTGIIVLFDNNPDVSTYTVFMDIKDKIAYDDPTEFGLLGLAFHPNYRENGFVFVKYTPKPNVDIVSRFTKSATGDTLDLTTEKIILSWDKEDAMHHGGSPNFGSDGMLYIAMGDGVHFAKCYRPENPAPLLNNLLGKMLRIDVDREDPGKPYAIPNDNPFVGVAGARGEIFAYGLRNPWKFSFDPPTKMIWLADVGYALWEEINIILPGRDYGWHGKEGTHCFYPKAETCPLTGNRETLPILDYPHTKEQCKTTPCLYGRAVVGGYVYRGTRVPSLSGAYLFADYDVGTFWILTPDASNPYRNTVRRMAPQFPGGKYNRTMRPSTFGIDMNSEIYLVNWDYPDIFKFSRELTPPPIPPPLPPKSWDNAPLWGENPPPVAAPELEVPVEAPKWGNSTTPLSPPLSLAPQFVDPPFSLRSPFTNSASEAVSVGCIGFVSLLVSCL